MTSLRKQENTLVAVVGVLNAAVPPDGSAEPAFALTDGTLNVHQRVKNDVSTVSILRSIEVYTRQKIVELGKTGVFQDYMGDIFVRDAPSGDTDTDFVYRLSDKNPLGDNKRSAALIQTPTVPPKVVSPVPPQVQPKVVSPPPPPPPPPVPNGKAMTSEELDKAPLDNQFEKQIELRATDAAKAALADVDVAKQIKAEKMTAAQIERAKWNGDATNKEAWNNSFNCNGSVNGPALQFSEYKLRSNLYVSLIIVHKNKDSDIVDICKFNGGAIVNAANEKCLGGGGVDGAIHRAAGPVLRDDCNNITEKSPDVRCPTGTAWITPKDSINQNNVSYPPQTVPANIPGIQVKRIIAVTGPVFDKHSDDKYKVQKDGRVEYSQVAVELLTTIRVSLKIAYHYKFESIAFPAISCGIFGYPYDAFARLMLDAIEFETKQRVTLRLFLFINDKDILQTFQTVIRADSRFVHESTGLSNSGGGSARRAAPRSARANPRHRSQLGPSASRVPGTRRGGCA